MNFCTKVTFALALLLSSSEQTTQAQYTKKWGYIFNGADWVNDKTSQCSSTHQSPVDLRSSLSSDPFRAADGSDFKGQYSNLVKATHLNKGTVLSVSIPSATTDGVNNENYFTSQHAVKTYNAAKKYSATQIDFHSMAEHTVDGRRYDVEMKILHTADPVTGARRLQAVKDDYAGAQQPDSAVVSIFFDKVNYDKTVGAEEQQSIWKFFESLDLASAATDVDADNNVILAKDIDVPFGDMMSSVNFGDRWSYSGSQTTPPCTVGVLYQVVEKVLPISATHHAAIVAQLSKHTSVDYFDATGTEAVADDTTTPAQRILGEVGNFRIPNKLDYHNVRYMRAEMEEMDESDPVVTMYALAIVLAISVALSLLLAYCACSLMRSEQSVKAADDDNQLDMASARSSAKLQ